MSDPLSWSVYLGQWAGTRVRLHLFFFLFAAGKVLSAAWEKKNPGLAVAATLGWLTLLCVVLAIRFVVQGVMALRLGIPREEIRVWPAGDLGRPGLSAAERSPEASVVAASGLLTNLALALAAFIALRLVGATMMLNPFGDAESGGAPILASGDPAHPFRATWWVGQFGYLNWVLFVVNLVLPALPMDGGRIYRSVLAARSRDGMIGPHTARALAAILVVIGLVRWLYLKRPGSGELFELAFLIEWMRGVEVRSFDEGNFYDDGIFGYDFSQGYTSLEAGAATIRPPREGALKRWRRRRSEDRLRRRREEDAAEDLRMDAILDKIHREGRASLTDEEQRFLVRVSAKYKNRARGS